MVSAKITLKNPTGMHMRPASEFVYVATTFESSIYILFKDKKINGKSIMNIMSACIRTGDTIEIQCDGPVEQAMLDAEIKLIENNFASDEK